jgi:hypothetical protein
MVPPLTMFSVKQERINEERRRRKEVMDVEEAL